MGTKSNFYSSSSVTHKTSQSRYGFGSEVKTAQTTYSLMPQPALKEPNDIPPKHHSNTKQWPSQPGVSYSNCEKDQSTCETCKFY